MVKKLMRERNFPPLPAKFKPNGKDPLENEDEKMLADNFKSRLENDFNVICNVVYVLPIEFDVITKVT